MPHTIDCIITSPPYNTSRLTQTESALKNRDNRYDVHLDDMTDEQYIQWSIDLFNLYNTILKKDTSVLYNLSYSSYKPHLIWYVVSEIVRNTVFTPIDTIIWKKDSATPCNTSPNKLTRICEFIFVFVRKHETDTFHMNKEEKAKSHTGQSFFENKFNFIEARNNDGANDLNKATFSTDLVRNLLLLYTKPGDVVYDSFMGTGTTAEACVIEGRRYIGSELSAAQCAYAENRLRTRLSMPSLF